MIITTDKATTINYTLNDSDGKLIDESKDSSFIYLHGHGNIIPGLESALEGKSAGEIFNLIIEPADAYGEYNPAITQTVPRQAFGGEAIEVGMQFNAESDDDHPVLITISEISGDEITIDGNPPLAGVTLHYAVEVMDVRDATEKELSHGHIHAHGESCGHEHQA
ncbi:FKBP-type peptidyl-prolyl cis-trans isomerase SlyD [hydrothermal vent metagenome]|uniref:peptidylprolyl isomerase n=1 Tax=hydrothermal vent metagenome TaxID=652676 RepID=A0A3B0XBP4_9ZZZZ